MNNYKDIAEKLWDLLDDISTAGDMFKPEHTPYFNYINKKCEERSKYMYSPDGFTLRWNIKPSSSMFIIMVL